MPNNDFPNFGFIPLGYDPTRLWEPEKSFSSRKDARNGQIGVMLRVFGDVLLNGVEVAQRLWRPYNPHALQPKAALGLVVWNTLRTV